MGVADRLTAIAPLDAHLEPLSLSTGWHDYLYSEDYRRRRGAAGPPCWPEAPRLGVARSATLRGSSTRWQSRRSSMSWWPWGYAPLYIRLEAKVRAPSSLHPPDPDGAVAPLDGTGYPVVAIGDVVLATVRMDDGIGIDITGILGRNVGHLGLVELALGGDYFVEPNTRPGHLWVGFFLKLLGGKRDRHAKSLRVTTEPAEVIPMLAACLKQPQPVAGACSVETPSTPT